MESLLYLVHRIPYPPNKGDKIRSYHLLKHLAERFHVHLGTFIDDPDDHQYVDALKKICAQTHFATIRPRSARLRSLAAFAANRPLSIDYYKDAGLQCWVNRVLQDESVKRVVVFSSPMAQYVEHANGVKRVIDFVDIDSDKWMQYAESKFWPASWLYRREGTRLLAYERSIARQFDASLFVSHAESKMFQQLAPESADRISYFNNGVDTHYFSADRGYPNPYQDHSHVIVFTGAMDYWPNVDAVQWFAREVFPSIRAANPKAVFYIVGARPAAQVQALGSIPGVFVTGSVPDVRPFIAHAKVSVAPLRIARGIQNKVLEAMAMSKPVVVSPQALEGIDAAPGEHLLLAETPEQYVATVSFALTHSTDAIACAARQRVESRYEWAGNLSRVDELLGAPNEPTINRVTR